MQKKISIRVQDAIHTNNKERATNETTTFLRDDVLKLTAKFTLECKNLKLSKNWD